MYLVVECTTTSAPRSRGVWKYGVAKVLSTVKITFASFEIAARAWMSTSFSKGLVGVSTQSNLVSGRRAAFTAARSEASTQVNSMP
ncbi:hypothetical protein D3C72_2293000 [compost metagenome]